MNAPERNTAFFAFDNSYARLPERFFARLPPTAVKAPRLVRINEALARHLNLDPDALASEEGVAVLSGSRIPDGADPIAMAYAGHQFGTFVPQLGDGRAILLGEVIGRDGVRRDIQLKGSGRTPFSRMGDGRAGIGPVLREYIVSEGMAALGIPTTRALAAVTTGEPVMREAILPGAVLTRVARSHIRVGTFQYFSVRKDHDAVRALADHVIARHYPEARETENRYRALLDAVVTKQAALVAQWLNVGFIHGVMNTDNMSIAGETIDYGPCAFMDTYHSGTVFSSIDHMGRYAYGNQPGIAHWNLSRLAQAMLSILGDDEEAAIAEAQASIDAFPDLFEAAWLDGLRAKLGFEKAGSIDFDFAKDFLERMADNEADFTLVFRRLSMLADEPGQADESVSELFNKPADFHDWAKAWRKRLNHEMSTECTRQAAMKAVNPAYIPRNHLVEEALQSAHRGDYEPFEDLLAVLARPYDGEPAFERYAKPPRPDQVVHQTFCGT